MNIDPKSETQKPDFEQQAKAHVIKLYGSCSPSDLPDRLRIESFIAGANHGYFLKSQTIDFMRSQNDSLTKINEELVNFLRSLHDGPMSWGDRKKLYNLLEKSKPLNHEQS